MVTPRIGQAAGTELLYLFGLGAPPWTSVLYFFLSHSYPLELLFEVKRLSLRYRVSQKNTTARQIVISFAQIMGNARQTPATYAVLKRKSNFLKLQWYACHCV